MALVLLGQRLIDAMPEPMAVALRNYTFPALYGAVFVIFLQTARTRAVALVGTAVALVVLVLPISPVFSATVAGVLGIIASFAMARRTPAAADAAVQAPER